MFDSSKKDDTIPTLKHTVHEAGNELHSTANQAGRKVRSMYKAASEEVSHASDIVTEEIRLNPVRSSVIALGVGVLLGALIRR